MIDDIPFVLSIREAVIASKQGRTSLFKAIEEGKIKAKKAGRRTLIEGSEFRRYITSLPASDGSQNAA